MEINGLTAACAGVFAIYLLALAVLRLTQDENEPPVIDSSIPFISPILSLMRNGYHYWGLRRTSSRLPIYTLQLPFVRLYIVNSPSLLQNIHRQPRKISFSTVMVQMASTVTGMSVDSARIIAKDHLQSHGFLHELVSTVRSSLSPGSTPLNMLNRNAIQAIAKSLDMVATGAETPVKINMYGWIKHQVMMATTEGAFGPQNPFRDTKIQQAFFAYERGFVRLMISVLPSLTARKSSQARTTLEGAYMKYYERGGHNDLETSALIRERHRFCSENGLPLADIIKMEVTSSIALLSNTMPATFWLAYHIFSDPELLKACRDELAHAIKEHNGRHSIDMAYVKSRCPLLLSTFQEILRFYSVGLSTRMVMEDTMLDKQYLVKKGGIMFIPDNAHEFLARRFLPRSPGSDRGYDPVAFRAFGGGSTLCPGRHFAATEILAFASLIILRFDARPAKRQWAAPSTENTPLGTTVRQPDYDIEIELQARDNYQWDVQFSDSDHVMPVSAHLAQPVAKDLRGKNSLN
ncbi:cytochrome P450 [Xylariaceae sp. FL1272]|nr:cytochrome P450 [Xylariaceae sp. FL1272]